MGILRFMGVETATIERRRNRHVENETRFYERTYEQSCVETRSHVARKANSRRTFERLHHAPDFVAIASNLTAAHVLESLRPMPHRGRKTPLCRRMKFRRSRSNA